MGKPLTKTRILALAVISSSLIFGATEERKEVALSDVITDIRNATPSSTLTITKCVLDFSDHRTILASSARMGGYLLAEETKNTLDLADFVYLTFEGIAAGARQDPEKFGKLARYFTDKDAVYNNFMQIAGSIQQTQQELVILADLGSCTNFVQQTISKDLPTLLKKMGATEEDQADITLLATVFTPTFAQLINKTYLGAVGAAEAFNGIVDNVAKGGINCGCLPWGKKKK